MIVINKIKHGLAGLILIFAMIISMSLTASAVAEFAVLQASVAEQRMTIFTGTELSSGELRCTVSNQAADISAFGHLSDEAALIKTSVLVDISTSIPSAVRDEVIATLKSLIESKPSNEEVKLIAFGAEQNILQDFSSDRYELSNAIDKIKFNGTKSIIYDAIYSTIPHIEKSGGKITFYRTIVITDGVDDTESGITKEELFLKLQNERYPVDVIAVSKSEVLENKELAAIVRMSNGRYFSLISNADTNSLAQSLGVGDYYYFEAVVPAILLDGTTRQVDITDGSKSISIDMKFPVFDAPITEVPSATPEEQQPTAETPAETETPTVTPVPNEADTSASILSLFGKYTIVIFAVIVLVIAAAIVLIVLFVRGKRKGIISQKVSIVSSSHHVNGPAAQTEFVGDSEYSVGSQFTIKLTNLANPSNTWILPVASDLYIGRAEHCQVRVDDSSVSREQCKITTHVNGLVVMHVGSTNKTFLNGVSVVSDMLLHPGDTLKLGRVILRIDYIQALGDLPVKSGPQRNQGSGKTESIF